MTKHQIDLGNMSKGELENLKNSPIEAMNNLQSAPLGEFVSVDMQVIGDNNYNDITVPANYKISLDGVLIPSDDGNISYDGVFAAWEKAFEGSEQLSLAELINLLPKAQASDNGPDFLTVEFEKLFDIPLNEALENANQVSQVVRTSSVDSTSVNIVFDLLFNDNNFGVVSVQSVPETLMFVNNTQPPPSVILPTLPQPGQAYPYTPSVLYEPNFLTLNQTFVQPAIPESSEYYLNTYHKVVIEGNILDQTYGFNLPGGPATGGIGVGNGIVSINASFSPSNIAGGTETHPIAGEVVLTTAQGNTFTFFTAAVAGHLAGDDFYTLNHPILLTPSSPNLVEVNGVFAAKDQFEYSVTNAAGQTGVGTITIDVLVDKPVAFDQTGGTVFEADIKNIGSAGLHSIEEVAGSLVGPLFPTGTMIVTPTQTVNPDVLPANQSYFGNDGGYVSSVTFNSIANATSGTPILNDVAITITAAEAAFINASFNSSNGYVNSVAGDKGIEVEDYKGNYFIVDAKTGGDIYELNAPLNNTVPNGTNPDTNAPAVESFNFQFSNNLNETTAGNIVSITINDDAPTISISTTTQPSITVQESTLGSGLPPSTPGTSESASFAGSFIDHINYGADGPAATTPNATSYALSVSSAGVDSGLVDTLSGQDVLLTLVGGEVQGRTSGSNALVFTVDVDGSGNVTLQQDRAIVQPNSVANNGDQTVTIAAAADIQLTQTVTLTDSDGSTATSSATNNIASSLNFQDTGPSVIVGTIGTEPTVTAHESALGTPATGSYSGNFTDTPTYGPDGPAASTPLTTSYGLSITNADSGLKDTLSGQEIILSESGGVIDGKTQTSGALVFTVAVDGSGDVTLTQDRAIEQPNSVANNGDQTVSIASGDILLTQTAVVTDGDGSTATNSKGLDISSSLNFQDSAPTVSVSTTGTEPTVTAHESALGTPVTGSYSGNFTDTPTYGPDGPAASTPLTTSYGLSITNADSGLKDTLSGQEIILSESGGVISGKTQAGGALVFTVGVDSSGNVTLTQDRAIEQPNSVANNGDQSVSIASGDILLTQTAVVTDGDGSTATSSKGLDISSSLSFQDTGPSVVVSTTGTEPTVTAHESTIGTPATGSYSGNFSDTPTYGPDGAAASTPLTTSYGLSITNTDSGLKDTLSGQEIILSESGGVISGKTQAGGALVFTVGVDTSGNVTLTQDRAIEQPNSVANNGDQSVSIASGDILLTQTAVVTDGDGSTATSSKGLDISSSLNFQDTAPTLSISTQPTAVYEAGLSTGSDPGDTTNAPVVTTGTFTGSFGPDGLNSTPLSISLSTTGADNAGSAGAITTSTALAGNPYGFAAGDTIETTHDGLGNTLEVDITSFKEAFILSNPLNFTAAQAVESYSLTLKDGDGSTSAPATIAITIHDDPPVIGGAGNTVGYTEHSGTANPTVVDGGITVNDVVTTQMLSGATITISNNALIADDVLHFTNTATITGTYASGVLTLTGSDTLADYQAALRSITYSSNNADPTDGGTDLTRTITWQVNDGDGVSPNNVSNAPTSTIDVALINNQNFPDSSTTTNPTNTVATDHTLYTDQTLTGSLLEGDYSASPITGISNITEVTTLTGSSLTSTPNGNFTYTPPDTAPSGTDDYTFNVQNAFGSFGATAHFAVDQSSITPTLTTPGIITNNVNGEVSEQGLSDGSGSYITLTHSDSGNTSDSVTATGVEVSTFDSSGNLISTSNTIIPIDPTNGSGPITLADGTVQVSADGTFDYTANSGGVGGTYDGFSVIFADSTHPNSVVVNNPLLVEISNPGPTIAVGTSAESTASFPMDTPAAVTLDSSVNVSDPVSTTLTSATVDITSGFQSGDVLAVAAVLPPSGFSDSYNATNGELTINATGVNATLANFDTVLHSVTFNNSTTDPSLGGTDLSRTISWQANDGTYTSAPATSTVNLTSTYTVAASDINTLELDIAIANAQQGNAVITVNGGGTFDFSTVGSLEISSNITINMDGATFTGSNATQLFLVDAGSTLIINGGSPSNMGVIEDGAVTMTGSFNGLSTVPAVAQGGAIDSSGNLTLNNVDLQGNTATANDSYGTTKIGPDSQAEGGAIYNNGGNLTITNSTLSGNSATANATNTENGESSNAIAKAYGGAIYNNGGSDTITNTTISGNSAVANSSGTTENAGGGIYLNGSSVANTNVTYSGNTPDNINDGTNSYVIGALPTSSTYTPIILDLTGAGIYLTSPSDSHETIGQITGTQNNLPVGWITAGEGVLMLNSNGNGTITNPNQISFVSYLPGATTDLQGLAAFDTNHDGKLDAGDADFAQFGVLLANGRFESLSQLGITSISLTSNNQAQTMNGNIIYGMTSYTTTSGKTFQAADTGLAVGPVSKGASLHTHDIFSVQHNIDFSKIPHDHHLSSSLPLLASNVGSSPSVSWTQSHDAGVANVSAVHSVSEHLHPHHELVHGHG